MIGIIVFYVKCESSASEGSMKIEYKRIEEHNKELFGKLRNDGFEFMFVPTQVDVSRVDVCFFNAPPGLNIKEEDK